MRLTCHLGMMMPSFVGPGDEKLSFQAKDKGSTKKRDLEKKNISFEPDLNQRPMDFCQVCQLQSTALPTELSKVAWQLLSTS